MDGAIKLFSGLLDWVVDLLPGSPFIKAINLIGEIPYLSMLNWLIPINTFIIIGGYWLSAIGIFYLYSIILRWVKAIE